MDSRLRNYLIIIVFLSLLLAIASFFLLKPFPPSAYRQTLMENTYLSATVRTSDLLAPPFSSFFSNLGSPVPSFASWMGFLLPPLFSIYLHEPESKVGAWVLTSDLGWRSRPYRWFSGYLQNRIPSHVYLLQDEGTLFVTSNPYLLDDLQEFTPSIERKASGRKNRAQSPLMVIDLFNQKGEVNRWMDDLQSKAQFLLFPSIREVESIHADFDWNGHEKIEGHMAVRLYKKDQIESVRGDSEYLLDLLDRIMATGNVQLDRQIQTESGQIRIRLILHHPEGLSRIPWNRLKENL